MANFCPVNSWFHHVPVLSTSTTRVDPSIPIHARPGCRNISPVRAPYTDGSPPEEVVEIECSDAVASSVPAWVCENARE
jgi:hypothetical protein